MRSASGATANSPGHSRCRRARRSVVLSTLVVESLTDLILLQNEDIKASMANGVLDVTFPKSAPETAPSKIPIS